MNPNGPRAKFVRTTEPGENGPLDHEGLTGRPSKYDNHMHPLLVLELMSEGRTLNELARDLGIYHSTMDDWKRKHPDFAAAIKEGLVLSQAWWEQQGRESVTLPHGVKFQAALYTFMMFNRFDYKSAITKGTERREEEHTHTHRMQFDVEDLTTSELRVLHKVLGQYLASRAEPSDDVDGTGTGEARTGGAESSTLH